MSTSAISGPPAGRCATADVDLEALAGGYDHRPPSPAALTRAAAAVSGISPGSWVLDSGAGLGDHAALWARSGYRALALDPGVGMIGAAARRGDLTAVRGRSQSMPFRDHSLSLVYFHLSIHYGDWRRSIDEATRVLEPGGRCLVWTLGARHHHGSMLARWFPSVAGIDSARFPEPSSIAARLARAGHDVERYPDVETVSRTAGEWIAAVRAGFVSTLQLLDEDEIESGLAAFAATHPDPEETIVYELHWDAIRGRRR